MTFPFRALRRRPGFSLVVILTLGLGIGATTSVFSVINGVVLRPLPYPHAEQLFTLFEQDSLRTGIQLPSYPTFLDWHEQNRVFESLAYIRGTGLTLQAGDRASLVLAAFVSEDFFRALNTRPLHGRLLMADDYRGGSGLVVLLSNAVWRRSFGADPSVVGRTISVGNSLVTIVGVMPPSFTYPEWSGSSSELWLPLAALPPADLTALNQRDFHGDSRVIARLGNGESLPKAQAELDAIAGRLAAVYPAESGRWTRVWLLSLTEFTVGKNVRTRLYLFGAAVALVLLICCVNLANLYLAQGAARRQEFAIRAALGASRGRVVHQLLAEILLVASLGGALGILLTAWALQLVRIGAFIQLPRLHEVSLDLRVLSFALGLTALTVLLFAMVATRRVASPDLSESLGERADSAPSRGGRGRLPAWLLVAQVGLTVVLLIWASLLTQGFWRLSQVDPGFDPERLILVRIEPPAPTYDRPQAGLQLYERLVEAIAAVPGVRRVGLINHPPVGRGGLPSRAAIGHPPTGTSDDLSVLFETVSAGYLSLMKIPLLAGREFSAVDVRGPPGPVIINEALARQWGGRSPLGERLDVLKAARTRPDFGKPISGVVIGVARDVKHFGLDTEPTPTVYVPYTHNLWASIVIIARTTGPAEPLLMSVDQVIRRVDPSIPLEGPGLGAGTMSQRLRSSYASRRFNAVLVSAFGMTALLLAAIGIYGVMSYTVTLETKEIGIRMALGAAPAGVLRAVVGRVAGIALAGLFAGVVAALGLTRLIRSLLFEVKPTDPEAYVFVAILLLAVATLAGFLPARRAASVDPVIALRS